MGSGKTRPHPVDRPARRGRPARRRAAWIVVFALLGAGCGDPGGIRKGPSSDDPDAVEVAGAVTLDGVTLTAGDISFDGADGRPPVAATVVNGSYSARMSAGTKTVRVNRYRETGRNDQYGRPIRRSDIPARYNAATTLAAEIVPRTANVVDFALTSR